MHTLGAQVPALFDPPNTVIGGGKPALLLKVEPSENDRRHGEQTEENGGGPDLKLFAHEMIWKHFRSQSAGGFAQAFQLLTSLSMRFWKGNMENCSYLHKTVTAEMNIQIPNCPKQETLPH
jgi:hypothetical protein